MSHSSNALTMYDCHFKDTMRICTEIFIDDFSVYRESFEIYLCNLEKVVQRYKEKNLFINRKKCHFIVSEEIMLDHKISKRRIKMDRVEMEATQKLNPHTFFKEIRSLLGQAGIYRKFRKDLKDCKSCNLLMEKSKLIIMSTSGWNSPFELICNASDQTIRAILEFLIFIQA